MTNNEIFDRLVEHAQRPVPPRPARLRFNLQHLRADVAATSYEDLEELVAVAEDAHHAHVLEHWTREQTPQIPEQSTGHWDDPWCTVGDEKLLPLLETPVEEEPFVEGTQRQPASTGGDGDGCE